MTAPFVLLDPETLAKATPAEAKAIGFDINANVDVLRNMVESMRSTMSPAEYEFVTSQLATAESFARRLPK